MIRQQNFNAIIKNFEIEEVTSSAGEEAAINELKKILAAKIAYLLTEDMQRLKWILYRIDVSEAKVTAVLNTIPFSRVPHDLADLIIEREMQKARTRIEYSRSKNASSSAGDDIT